MCFLITGFVAEVRSGSYGFGKDVKVFKVRKAVSAINETTSVSLNRGTGPLKLIKTKWIIPLEIVLNGFGKYDPPVRKKLPVEVDIPEWLCMKGLENLATEHEQAIGDCSLI